MLLANPRGTYLGAEGQDPLFAALDERRALAFVHPAALPDPEVPGIPPFATDFLLDTSRAAYVLGRNDVVAATPTSASCSPTPAASCPGGRTAWPWAWPASPVAASVTDLRSFCDRGWKPDVLTRPRRFG